MRQTTRFSVITMALFFLSTSLWAQPMDKNDPEYMKAKADADYWLERRAAHTKKIPAAEYKHAYPSVMRKIFFFPASVDLSEADIAIIRATQPPSGEKIYEPYLRQVAEQVDTASAVDLAAIYQAARDAEQDAKAAYYRDLIKQLSKDGQRKIKNAYKAAVKKHPPFSRTDIVGLAADTPDVTRRQMKEDTLKYRPKTAAPSGNGNPTITLTDQGENHE